MGYSRGSRQLGSRDRAVEGKCPICAGRGMGGQDIQHALRQCTRGGSQTLRSELAVAM